MKPLPATSKLLSVAERVVWFKAPSEALAAPVHFLAHVMTYGNICYCLLPLPSGRRNPGGVG
jgi:hypothetical protein